MSSTSTVRKNNKNASGRGSGSGRHQKRGALPKRQESGASIRDEDVLIAFMPFMRDENPGAVAIYSRYQASNDQSSFTSEAREFLRRQKDAPTAVISSQLEKLQVHNDPILDPAYSRSSPGGSPKQGRSPVIERPNRNISVSPLPSGLLTSQQQQQQQQQMSPSPFTSVGQGGPPPGLLQSTHRVSSTINPGIPPPGMAHIPNNTNSVPLSTHNGMMDRARSPVPGLTSLFQHASLPLPTLMTSPKESPHLSPNPYQPEPQVAAPMTPPRPIGNGQPSVAGVAAPALDIDSITLPPEATPLKPKHVYQPKRLWTRVDQQPGRILANDLGTKSTIPIQPRHELTAKWILPLKYLRQRALDKNLNPENMSLRDALESLTVGLFRRGCAENGTNASIISKEVLTPANESRPDYFFNIDKAADAVWGTVPFYAPRTPGHVLFRLFWQDEPVYTLATGPTLYVTVSEKDFEPTLRFVLSNFKSKKGSMTSLSSLNSLATVLDQFRPTDFRQNYNKWDAAGRAAWGCVCESRKVLETCASEYMKTKEKLAKLEEEVEDLKSLVGDECLEKELTDSHEHGMNGHPADISKSAEMSASAALLRERTGALHSGRSANERKWKDAQCAFASVLKAIVNNQNTTLLFRRELLAKIRLEYELWCPLAESFAHSPWNRPNEVLCVNFQAFPQHVTQAHYNECIGSRLKLLKESLGFVPNRLTLKQVVMSSSQPQSMDRKAVEVFNRLSGAMGQLYQDEYMVEDRIMKQREMVRSHVESIVAQCNAFPSGTRVVVFGSAANGFGSPSSDLDMCLQLPQGSSIISADDPTGAVAMGKLAEHFERAGLQNVDTARLTARIPIIMSKCPRPLALEGEDPLMECDLSMQNPLACLNTSLLLTYSQIHPVTKVLGAVVKRWAKARDINSPSQGTLSSYGYIIMLLHFLTYHRRDGTGLVTTIAEKPEINGADATPLLPNLQWMDIKWPTSPNGTPYNEQTSLPTNLIQHPIEPDMVVNTYFYRLADQKALQDLQRRFPSQDLSLAILLASFFRYYAYDFDYKKYVVSLQATATNGMIEREVKAELNGWKVYSTGLAIEDPFETFYDVAHVLKGYNFHRLRNEFALAYTKIADVAAGRTEGKTGRDLIDWICEPAFKDDEAQKS